MTQRLVTTLALVSALVTSFGSTALQAAQRNTVKHHAHATCHGGTCTPAPEQGCDQHCDGDEGTCQGCECGETCGCHEGTCGEGCACGDDCGCHNGTCGDDCACGDDCGCQSGTCADGCTCGDDCGCQSGTCGPSCDCGCQSGTCGEGCDCGCQGGTCPAPKPKH